MMVAAGIRLTLVTHVGAALPFATFFLVDPGSIAVPSAAAGSALLAVSVVWAVIDLRRAARAESPALPSAWAALAHLLVLVVALTIMNHSLGSSAAWGHLILILPLTLAALVGAPGFVATVYATAMVGFAVSTSMIGAPTGNVVATIIAFALGAGAVTGIVAIVSNAMVQNHGKLLNLVNAASAVAQAESVEEGAAQIAEMLRRTHLGGNLPTHVEVFRCGIGRTELLDGISATWVPTDDGPHPALVIAAGDSYTGIATGDGHGLMLADESGGDILVFDITVTIPTGVEHNSMVFDLARFALQLRVLVQRINALDELDRLGQTDDLTGLPNRRALMQRLDHERGQALANDAQLSLVLIDIDDFKAYNDRFGHSEGDRLLVDLSAMLQKRIRSADLVARYGGEEFCLVLPTTGDRGARRLLDELHTWAALLRPGEQITFSAGSASWDERETIAELVNRVDRALYLAKATGKNRTVVADPPAEDANAAGTGDMGASAR